jgi:hypothetical protein
MAKGKDNRTTRAECLLMRGNRLSLCAVPTQRQHRLGIDSLTRRWKPTVSFHEFPHHRFPLDFV